MSEDLALQTEIYSRVTAQLAADGLSVPVTAHPVTDEQLPYVAIGEIVGGRDNPIGIEFEAEIRVYSKTNGPHEVKKVQKSVRTALHGQAIDAAGYRFTQFRIDYTSAFLDETEDVWQGVQRIRVLAS